MTTEEKIADITKLVLIRRPLKEINQALAALIAAEMEKKDAVIWQINDQLKKEEAYGFSRYVEREEMLKKKDAEIADLKFTAFKRLQDIQILERQIAEMTERADVRTEVIAEAGKAITALEQRIAELEGKGNIHLDQRTAK